MAASSQLLSSSQETEEDEEREMLDLERGLMWDEARRVASSGAPNRLRPPLEYPAWVCCLLPCLLSTSAMRQFHASVPESALVLREGEWTDVDASSLVVRDVVRLGEGDRAPADLRVVRCDDAFAVDTVALEGQHTRTRLSPEAIVPLSTLCVSGEATLVVIAIGDDTQLARRLCVHGVLPSPAHCSRASQAGGGMAGQDSEEPLRGNDVY